MPLRSYTAILKQTGKGWVEDKAARLGAALAFYSILSLGPMLLLVLTMATYIWGHESAQGRIISQMTQIVGPNGAGAIATILKAGEKPGNNNLLATVFGLATLLFSASGAFGELQDAMNTIWKVKKDNARPMREVIRARLFSFLMVMGSGVLLMLSFFLSTILSILANDLNRFFAGAAFIGHMFDIFTSLFIISLLFGLTFKIVPDRPIPWRHVRVAAVITAILFVIGKIAIAFYIGHTGIASSYGAAGSVVILLVWIYYSSQIIFFGAEFAYAYAQALEASETPILP